MDKITDQIMAEAATKHNDTGTYSRALFLCNIDQILSLSAKGYSIKAIWRILHDRNCIQIGYGQFYNFFKKYQKSQEKYK